YWATNASTTICEILNFYREKNKNIKTRYSLKNMNHIAIGIIVGLLGAACCYFASRQQVTYIAHNRENPVSYRGPTCMICRSEVRNQVAREMFCGHIFHLGCLNGGEQCPTCH
uniref:RING-type domain-containing protein n=1 Tax=Glossina pallidipes TaxID=7398 RepID=A0A1B0A3J8_GLOPL